MRFHPRYRIAVINSRLLHPFRRFHAWKAEYLYISACIDIDAISRTSRRRTNIHGEARHGASYSRVSACWRAVKRSSIGIDAPHYARGYVLASDRTKSALIHSVDTQSRHAASSKASSSRAPGTLLFTLARERYRVTPDKEDPLRTQRPLSERASERASDLSLPLAPPRCLVPPRDATRRISLGDLTKERCAHNAPSIHRVHRVPSAWRLA